MLTHKELSLQQDTAACNIQGPQIHVAQANACRNACTVIMMTNLSAVLSFISRAWGRRCS